RRRTMRLAGRVIGVTGAGLGIGRACAIAYGREGAYVAVTDLDGAAAETVAAELRAAGCSAAAWPLDVTDGASVEPLLLEIEQQLGPLDVWHNNAGVSSMNRFVDLTDEEWDRNMAVNAKGTFLCSRAFARY